MSVRKTPFYALQFSKLLFGRVPDCDLPLDNIHDLLDLDDKQMQKEYTEILNKYKPDDFPAERQKILRHVRFSSLNSEDQKQLFNLKTKHIKDLQGCQELKCGLEAISQYYNIKKFKLDNQASYNIINYCFKNAKGADMKKFCALSEAIKIFHLPAMPGVQNKNKINAFQSYEAINQASSWVNCLIMLEKIKSMCSRLSTQNKQQKDKLLKKQTDFKKIITNDSPEEQLQHLERGLQKWKKYSSRSVIQMYRIMYQEQIQDYMYALEMIHPDMTLQEREQFQSYFIENKTKKNDLEQEILTLDYDELIWSDGYDSFMAEQKKELVPIFDKIDAIRQFVPLMFNKKQGVFCHKKGVYIAQRDGSLHSIHRTQLDACTEVVGEIVSSIISHYVHYGEIEAQYLNKFYINSYENLSKASYDEANMVSCTHRDLEMKLFTDDEKQSALKDAQELYHGYGIQNLIRPLEEFILKTDITPIKWSRSLRSFLSVHYDAITLLNEQQKCMTLVQLPDPDILIGLKNAVKQLCHRFYLKKMGRHPKTGFDDILEWDPERLQAVEEGYWLETNSYENVNFNGVAENLWSEDAWTSKDSTNVPMDIGSCSKGEVYKNLPLNQRREVLYYKDNSATKEINELQQKIKNKQLSQLPIRITVKPEQKEAGRMIHMESCGVRKVNSQIQNNIIQIPSCYWGSLLGKSLQGKLSAINRLIELGQLSQDEGWQVFYISLDFAKFGHTIPQQTDAEVLKVVADFFGKKWVGSFLDILDHSRLFATYMGVDAEINNQLKADGQGMRNGIWQLLLLASLNIAMAPLYNKYPQLDQRKPIAPVFYQDDHVLLVCWKPVDIHNVHLEFEQLKIDILQAITTAYTNLGLQIQPQKTEINKDKFKLLGDYFNLKGFIDVPTKAIQTFLRPSDSRAPTLMDHVSDIVSSAHSAVISGQDPLKVFLCMITLTPIKLSLFPLQWTHEKTTQLAIQLSIPAHLGGLGLCSFQHLYIGSHCLQTTDAIYCLYEHIDTLSFLVYAASGIMHNVLTKPNKLQKSLLADEVQKVIAMTQTDIYNHSQYEILKKTVHTTFRHLPHTQKQWLFDIHPWTEQQKIIDKVVKSASAVDLVAKGVINRCKQTEIRRAYKWLSHLNLIQPEQKTYKDILNQYERLHGPIIYRTPSNLLLIPTTQAGKDLYLGVSIFRHEVGQQKQIIAHANIPKPIIKFSSPVNDKVASEVLQVATILYALNSEYGNDAKHLVELIIKIWGFRLNTNDFLAQGFPVTYRDVPFLTLNPSVVITWAGEFLYDFSVHTDTFPKTDSEITKNPWKQRHMNYGLATALAVICKDDSQHFMYHQNLKWNSPDIRTQTQDPLVQALKVELLIKEKRERVKERLIILIRLREAIFFNVFKEGNVRTQNDNPITLTDQILAYSRRLADQQYKKDTQKQLKQTQEKIFKARDKQIKIELKQKNKPQIKEQQIEQEYYEKEDIGLSDYEEEFESQNEYATQYVKKQNEQVTKILIEDIYTSEDTLKYLPHVINQPIKYAQKQIFQNWVRLLFVQRSSQGFSWIEELSKLPNLWKTRIMQYLTEDEIDIFQKLLPTMDEASSLVGMLESTGTWDEFNQWIEYEWKKSTKRMDFALGITREMKLITVFKRIPRLYLRQLILSVKSLPRYDLQELDSSTINSFFYAWADRYRSSLRVQISILKGVELRIDIEKNSNLDIKTQMEIRGLLTEDFFNSKSGKQLQFILLGHSSAQWTGLVVQNMVNAVTQKFQSNLQGALDQISWHLDEEDYKGFSDKLIGMFVSRQHASLYASVHTLRLLTQIYAHAANCEYDIELGGFTKTIIQDVLSSEMTHIINKFNISTTVKDRKCMNIQILINKLYDAHYFGKAYAILIAIDQVQKRSDMMCEDLQEQKINLKQMKLEILNEQQYKKFAFIRGYAKIKIDENLIDTPLLTAFFRQGLSDQQASQLTRIIKTDNKIERIKSQGKKLEHIQKGMYAFGIGQQPVFEIQKQQQIQKKQEEKTKQKQIERQQQESVSVQKEQQSKEFLAFLEQQETYKPKGFVSQKMNQLITQEVEFLEGHKFEEKPEHEQKLEIVDEADYYQKLMDQQILADQEQTKKEEKVIDEIVQVIPKEEEQEFDWDQEEGMESLRPESQWEKEYVRDPNEDTPY